MQWIAQNTLLDSRFAVVTGHGALYSDNTIEWFPVLSQRQSVMTIQGTEWFPDFSKRVTEYNLLQNCTKQDVSCLENWKERTGKIYSYIYLSLGGADNNILRISLAESSDYEQVYTSPSAIIFKRKA
jgi:hypothetical protein